MRVKLLICSLLFAVTLGVYWPVRTHDFVYYDDPQFITENEEVKAGLTYHGFIYAFTQPVVGNWHPVTTLSHMLDCQLFGVSPGAHHLANAFIHALNAALLFLVLSRMTGAQWRSAAVAALFALHPLRVESVAWVSERKDVLCWSFGLLSLLAYVRYASESRAESPKSKGWYVAAVGLFACGLMCKAMLVTFPFVLLLLDWWPLERLKHSVLKSLVMEKIPFLVLALVFCFVTLQVQKDAGAMSVIDRVDVTDRLVNAIVSYGKYLGKLFWPTDLVVIYPHPAASYAAADRWAGWQVGLALLGGLAISAYCLLNRQHRPYLAVGWSWFLGALVPVIGLVQVGEQAMADRYTYIPLIGPVIALVWLVAEFGARFRWNKSVVIGASALVMGGLAIQTCHQLGFWKNTISLFQHNIQVTPANPSAHFALGVGLEKENQTVEALNEYRRAVDLNPRYKKAFYNSGQIYRKQGHWEEAATAYRRALDIDPGDLAARLNFASVLSTLNQNKDAIVEFESVLKLAPDSLEALNNLAWILATASKASLRDGARAVSLAERACQLTQNCLPSFTGTLAAAYAEAGRFAEAVATAQQAIDLAKAAGQTELAARNAELQKLYRARQPYHEPIR